MPHHSLVEGGWASMSVRAFELEAIHVDLPAVGGVSLPTLGGSHDLDRKGEARASKGAVARTGGRITPPVDSVTPRLEYTEVLAEVPMVIRLPLGRDSVPVRVREEGAGAEILRGAYSATAAGSHDDKGSERKLFPLEDDRPVHETAVAVGACEVIDLLDEDADDVASAPAPTINRIKRHMTPVDWREYGENLLISF